MTPRAAAALAAIGVLAVLLAVVEPRRLARRLDAVNARAAADPAARLRTYRRYLAFCAAGALLYAAVVLLGGRGFRAAGLGWTGADGYAGLAWAYAALVGPGLALAAVVRVARRRAPDVLDRDRQLARLAFLAPRRPAERRWWPVLAVAIAGQEELVFRGLLTLYAAALAGVSPWWLVVPSSVAFGLAHRYQGWFGMAATGLLGLSYAMLAAALGSLWPGIVAHALFDLRLPLLTRPARATPAPAAGSARPRRRRR